MMNSQRTFRPMGPTVVDDVLSVRRARLVDAARDRSGRHSPFRDGLSRLADAFGGGARPAFAG